MPDWREGAKAFLEAPCELPDSVFRRGQVDRLAEMSLERSVEGLVDPLERRLDVFGGEEREDRQRQLGDVKDILT